MMVSRGTALLLSAIMAGSLIAAGSAFAAEEAPASNAAAQPEARKPDVVLNKGGSSDATAEASGTEAAKTEVPKSDAGDAAKNDVAANETTNPDGENKPEASAAAAEPQVENEGDGVKPREADAKGSNLAGMRGDAAPAKSQVDAVTKHDDESAAEDAAMKEAAKITKEEEEKPAAKVKAEPTLFINIDLAKQRMVVSDGNGVKYTWKVSSGRYGYSTPTGTFNPVWMTKMWYSRQYDNAPMPHSIFFSGGAAIHATSYTNQLGMPASHGCVRLSPRNAETLFKLVSEHGRAKTQIVVHGTPNYQIAERRSRDRYDRYAYRYEYGEPSRYWREVPEWSYKRRYSTYYGTPPSYRYERGYGRNYGYRPRGVFSSNSGYYGYGY